MAMGLHVLVISQQRHVTASVNSGSRTWMRYRLPRRKPSHGQEKTFAELRSQFALDVVPTKSYAANSAWQQLNVLAHNLCRSFQLDTIAETKSISRKRTCTHLLHTIRTIRFRVINKAGRLIRVSGRNALRMATNSSTQTLFKRIEVALAS